MGLDVTAISKLEYRGVIDHGEDGEHHEDEYVAFAHPRFKDSTKGLKGMDDTFRSGALTFIGGHSYFVSETSEFASVSSSYSGHGDFRNGLAALVDLEQGDYWEDGFDPETPFYELVNFADNEGTIGPESAAALLKDFQQFHAKAVEEFDDYRLAKYEAWTECCRVAADNGMISFH